MAGSNSTDVGPHTRLRPLTRPAVAILGAEPHHHRGLVVKNTFLTVEDSQAHDTSQRCRARSCPCSRGHNREWDAVSGSESTTYSGNGLLGARLCAGSEGAYDGPFRRGGGIGSPLSVEPPESPAGGTDLSMEADDGSVDAEMLQGAPAICSAVPMCGEAFDAPGLERYVPVAVGPLRPAVSAAAAAAAASMLSPLGPMKGGSLLHATGRCKPCVYHARAICRHGLACIYCHSDHANMKWKRARAPKHVRLRLMQISTPSPGAGSCSEEC